MTDLAQQAEALAAQAKALETAAGELAAAASALALKAAVPPEFVTRAQYEEEMQALADTVVAVSNRVAALEDGEQPGEPEPVPPAERPLIEPLLFENVTGQSRENFSVVGAHQDSVKFLKASDCHVKNFTVRDGGHVSETTGHRLGHGVLFGAGAVNCTAENFISTGHIEDGAQWNQDAGDFCGIRNFVASDNREDGVDVKGGEGFIEDGLIAHNGICAINLHADRHTLTRVARCIMRGNDQSFQIRDRSYAASEDNVVWATVGPALKIKYGEADQRASTFLRDKYHDGESCTMLVSSGTGHRFTDCEGYRDDNDPMLWITGTADEIEWTGGVLQNSEGPCLKADEGKVFSIRGALWKGPVNGPWAVVGDRKYSRDEIQELDPEARFA